MSMFNHIQVFHITKNSLNLMIMAAFLLSLIVSSLIMQAYGADPELVKDYAADPSTTDASFFTFTGFRNDTPAPAGQFVVKKASVVEFPALEGLGVSYAKLSFQPGAVNAPHIHPRGTEVLYVEQGWLVVGLVDSTNKLFVQRLTKGDLFVFPKGLVHFQINYGPEETKALSAFSSSNPGTISIPVNIFGSGIADAVLTKAFKTSPETIKLLKSAFTK